MKKPKKNKNTKMFIKIDVKSFSDYVVNTPAIEHNLNEYKKIDNCSKVCAVVKADGYGIGAENVVDAIDKQVDFYAVACFEEADSLRYCTQKPVLVLNFVPLNCVDDCCKKNISISISSVEEIIQISRLKLHGKLKIHLAVNTGMNRIGFCDLKAFEKAVNLLKSFGENILVEGIYTHLYNAENYLDSKKQIRIFMQYIKVLSKHFDVSKIIKHACASLGAVKYPKFRFDMVRLGILLYGDLDSKKLALEPVVEVKSKIISVMNMKSGESVGYGKNFVAQQNMKIATIPFGYADGIFRQYAKNGYVNINGKNCKIVGNICMDMLMVDVSDANAKIGDNVELVGKNLPLHEVAQNARTIGYEMLTNIKKKRFNVKIIKNKA